MKDHTDWNCGPLFETSFVSKLRAAGWSGWRYLGFPFRCNRLIDVFLLDGLGTFIAESTEEGDLSGSTTVKEGRGRPT